MVTPGPRQATSRHVTSRRPASASSPAYIGGAARRMAKGHSYQSVLPLSTCASFILEGDRLPSFQETRTLQRYCNNHWLPIQIYHEKGVSVNAHSNVTDMRK